MKPKNSQMSPMGIYNFQPVYNTYMWYDTKTGKCIKNLALSDEDIDSGRYVDYLWFNSYKEARRFYRKHKEELSKYFVRFTVKSKKGISYTYEFTHPKEKYLNFDFKYWEENGDEAYLKKYHPGDLYLNNPYKYNKDGSLRDEYKEEEE